ncbi:MAG: aldehyde dehydrogenase family protein [Nitriliruptoraceae bacterium]
MDTAPDVTVTDTPPELRDEALATLRAHADDWAREDAVVRIALLDELRMTTLAAARPWVGALAQAKGHPDDPVVRGEEWIAGILPVLRNLLLLRTTLDDVVRTGGPRPPATSRGADGAVRVALLPAHRLDALLVPGFTAQARLTADVDEASVTGPGRDTRAGHDPATGEVRGEVALVLGAGNVASIAPMDVLHQLFVERRVVLLKPSPVCPWLGAHLAEAFEPLVRRGVLRIVQGGAEVGEALIGHPEINAVHLTGSADTHGRVLASVRQRPDAADVPVTAELGSVTPVIVVPGPWSRSDLRHQGHNIASMLVNNAGYNCVSARALIGHRSWSGRRALLEAVRSSLAEARPRVGWYPGAREQWHELVDGDPRARFVGPTEEPWIPWTLLAGLGADDVDHPLFTGEVFAPILGEVELDVGRSVPDFLDAAVDLCNDDLWGTLAVTIIVHPRSLVDAAVAVAVERAIDRLRYGTVLVNHHPGVAFGLGCTPWGAAPAPVDDDVPAGDARGPSSGTDSGLGFVHDTYLLRDVEKVVVRGPFRPRITPIWFHTRRGTDRLGERAARLLASDDPRHLPAVLLEAVRG